MEDPSQPPMILTLTGVTLRDYRSPESLADEQLITSAAETVESGVALARLRVEHTPTLHRSNEDWPIESGLRCHECGFTFSGPPVAIPTEMTEIIDGSGDAAQMVVEFRLRGTFCGFPCAELSLISGNLDRTERMRRQMLLRWFCWALYGVLPNTIESAKPRTEMTDYGGPMTDEEFLKHNAALSPIKDNRILARHATAAAAALPAVDVELSPLDNILGGETAAVAGVPTMTAAVAMTAAEEEELARALGLIPVEDPVAAAAAAAAAPTEPAAA